MLFLLMSIPACHGKYKVPIGAVVFPKPVITTTSRHSWTAVWASPNKKKCSENKQIWKGTMTSGQGRINKELVCQSIVLGMNFMQREQFRSIESVGGNCLIRKTGGHILFTLLTYRLSIFFFSCTLLSDPLMFRQSLSVHRVLKPFILGSYHSIVSAMCLWHFKRLAAQI